MAESKLQKKVQIRIETMAATLLLVVLAGLTMLLISSTGNSYRQIVGAGTAEQSLRTGIAFVATKVRQGDCGGNITVKKTSWGDNAIVIAQQTGGKTYENWIFYYNGALRECTIPAGDSINPPACAAVASLSAFSVSKSDSGLSVTMRKQLSGKSGSDGMAEQSITLTLRT